MIIKWIITKIISLWFAIVKIFTTWVTKYTASFIIVTVASLLALLSLKHCKFGIFVKCEDYTYNNTFKKGSNCKVLQVKIKENVTKEVEKLYN